MKYSVTTSQPWKLRQAHSLRRRRLHWGLTGVIVVAAGLILLLILPIRSAKSADGQHAAATSQNHVPLTAVTTPLKHGSNKPYGVALGDTAAFLTQQQLDQEFANLASWGVTWIRIDVSWADIQPQNATNYSWSGLDRVAASAKAHHLHVLGTLAYTPAWAAASGCTNSQECAPASDSQFALFAATAARRYAPQGWHDWEIWNEPNLQGFWRPAPSPTGYAALLKAVYPSLKSVDSQATVITGGMGPLDNAPASITQQTFLTKLYAAGAKPYFDAVGYHPYSFPAPPDYNVTWSGWSSMDDVHNSIRSIMAANGDSAKQIWITEYGAPTNGPGALATASNLNFNASPDHVSEGLQATMLTQAADKYEASAWLGSFFWYSYQDLGTSAATNENFFGLLRYDGTPKPALAALKQADGNN